MPPKHLYEYSVLRYVPCVARQEFVNVGVLLYCKSPRFIGMKWALNEQRILSFCPTANLDEVRAYLESMEKICAGGEMHSPMGMLDAASRFRWLSATRSTILQVSPVHPGLCDDPQAALQAIFREQVGDMP